MPGVLFIGGERIEYYLKEDGALRQLRRGTLGTGVKTKHSQGSVVLDQSRDQTVPYKDETMTLNFVSDGSTKAYTLDFVPQDPTGSGTVMDLVEVFVGGRRLRKNAISSFDPTTNLDSPEADTTLPAEFSMTAGSTTLTLTEQPPINTKIMVVRRIGKRWTDPGTPLRLAENNIGRFLRNKEVALPK